MLEGEMEQSSGVQGAQIQVPAPPLTAEEITGKFSNLSNPVTPSGKWGQST